MGYRVKTGRALKTGRICALSFPRRGPDTASTSRRARTCSLISTSARSWIGSLLHVPLAARPAAAVAVQWRTALLAVADPGAYRDAVERHLDARTRRRRGRSLPASSTPPPPPPRPAPCAGHGAGARHRRDAVWPQGHQRMGRRPRPQGAGALRRAPAQVNPMMDSNHPTRSRTRERAPGADPARHRSALRTWARAHYLFTVKGAEYARAPPPMRLPCHHLRWPPPGRRRCSSR